MEWLLNHLAATWSVLLLIVMQISYNHEGKLYKNGKGVRIEESRSFKAFYRWVRIVQLPAILIALYLGRGSFEVQPSLKLTGLLLSIAATAVFVHAKIVLGKNYSPCFDSFLPTEVVSRGIYKYVRHPIYAANILNFGAMFLFSGSYIVGVNLIVLMFFYQRSARLEEEKLALAFKEYRTYIENSGRFFPSIVRLLRR